MTARHRQTAWLAAVSAAIALAAWRPWGHPALALLVVLPWALCATRAQAFWSALAYYACAMADLTLIPGKFFALDGLAAWASGALAWFCWSALLAATQALPRAKTLANRPFAVLGGLVLTVTPPVGWLAVTSPLTSLGYWFPGTKSLGLVLGAVTVLILGWTTVFATVKAVRATAWHGVAWVAAGVAVAHRLYEPPSPPAGWAALDTRFGAYNHGQAETLHRAEGITALLASHIARGHEHGRGGRGHGDPLNSTAPLAPLAPLVVVLPEMVIGDWRPRTAYFLESAIEATAAAPLIWIAGASLANASIPTQTRAQINGGIVVANGQVTTFEGRISMPFGMWAPWRADSYAAKPWQIPVLDVAGQRVTVSLCYEDLLPWAQLQSHLQRPTLHLSLSSLWFAQGLNVATIKDRSVSGWAQLFGVPVLSAVNY